MSVEVPRVWEQKAENATGPRLLVSTDTANWQTSSQVEGVFMELLPAATLPTTTSPPPDCQPDTPDGGEAEGQKLATFRYSCTGPSVAEQYRQLNSTTLLRIQVRDDNSERREKVLNSATYSPS
jgi:eukaryotic-like serine/threonine-protein kinase